MLGVWSLSRGERAVLVLRRDLLTSLTAGTFLPWSSASQSDSYHGIVDSDVSLSSIIRAGRYLVLGALDKPLAATPNESMLLDVQVYADRWILQKLVTLNAATRQWVRVIDTGLEMHVDWVGQPAMDSGVSNTKLVTFGDSITEFATYHPQLQARMGPVDITNVGIGGTLLSYQQAQSGYCEFSFARIVDALVDGDWRLIEAAVLQVQKETQPSIDYSWVVERLKKLDLRQYGFATVFFGANDFGAAAAPIGAADSEDITTLNGALNRSVRRLMTSFPDLRLAFITPIYRTSLGGAPGTFDPVTMTNALGLRLIDYVDGLLEGCRRLNLPVLDLYRTSGINQFNASLKLPDGTHPGPAGGSDIGNSIASFLKATF